MSDLAGRLKVAAETAASQLGGAPVQAVTGLVEVLVVEILPWLDPGAPEYLELSEVTEALTIVALHPALARGRGRELSTARRLVNRVAELASAGSALETPSSRPEGSRSGLFFVAPPQRPATEAHVLRRWPRAVAVWRPGGRARGGDGN